MSANELPTSFTFTGQREAEEIGLMYYVARWYDSEIGHFLQTDTIVPEPGKALAWNRYAYVNYSPLNYNDPTGHFAWIAVGALFGAAVSYGVQVYNNYNSDMSGAEAWTNVDATAIVAGALIGAGAVILTPAAVAAASTGLAGAAVATGSVGLMEASIVTGVAASGLASVLYGPISGTVERFSDAASSVQDLFSPPASTVSNPHSLDNVHFLEGPSTTDHIFRDDAGHVMYDTPEWRQQMLDTVSWDNYKSTNEYGRLTFSRLLEDNSEMWVEVYNNTIRDAGVNQEWRWHSMWGK